MTKRMLIDAGHPEETRVVVLDGNRLEEFDLETANRRPLKGNIYLAKVVRVEPSLQAAFVEYGGNRHGFLAFGEIHPDYYQIPVADRQRLLEMQAQEAREDEEAEERAAQAREARRNRPRAPEAAPAGEPASEEAPARDAAPAEAASGGVAPAASEPGIEPPPEAAAEPVAGVEAPAEAVREDAAPETAQPLLMEAERVIAAVEPAPEAEIEAERTPEAEAGDADAEAGLAEEDRAPEAPPPETIGGEDPGTDSEDGESEGDSRDRRIPPRFLRHYKIQEVIRRRQILLVQVVKEERGSKGAALTTYISLAGRFSVLMPNSPRGGGVSRKITSAADRKRLREAIDEVGLPDGMSLIVRTAGANRPKPEIRRDCEYLLRLWDNIRERTLASTAPALIYEEADLIKRSIRDVFARDVEEMIVEGEDAYQQAREFMRMLMPANASKVRLHRDATPLFARHGVDAALDAMNSPTVQLRSGGYIVINQTEALVAIDVNSGRATRDRHIEDTALRTNLEAAEEIARQLRLRDLAGLIVIDFIDMESSKHDAMVEKRLKDSLRHDRARIQVGRISHFGLMEMSRQRLRPSIAEHNTVTCPHCQGRGFVRSVESSALQVLRAIEEEGARRRSAEIIVHVAGPVALYLLNRKRDRLAQIEARWAMTVLLQPDETLIPPALRVERTRAQSADALPVQPSALRMDYAPEPEEPEEVEEEEAEAAEEGAEPARAERRDDRERGGEEEAERRRRRRRRRGRGRREDGQPGETSAEAAADAAEDGDDGEEAGAEDGVAEAAEAEAAERPDGAEGAEGESAERGGDDADRRRRRGRRGGRRRRGDAPEGSEAAPEGEAPAAEPAAEEQRPAPRPSRARYAGPTPADPFAGQIDDIFSVMEAAEAAAEAEAEAAARAPRRAASAEALASDPNEPVTPEPAPQPMPPPQEPVPVPQPEPAHPATPEPAYPTEPEPITPADPEPFSPSAAPPAGTEAAVAEGPVAAPPVQPIVLGADAAEALPKRRGWWRR
jgi:ribonuclease E